MSPETSTHRTFVLLVNNEIVATAKDWNGMRDYCSETEKRGQVFVVETIIPFGGAVTDIVTTKKYFGEVG